MDLVEAKEWGRGRKGLREGRGKGKRKGQTSPSQIKFYHLW